MDNFLLILYAILPIILIILLGYFLKRIKLFDDNFLKNANKLIFKILLPIYLGMNIYKIESLNKIDYKIVLFSFLISLVIFGVGLIAVIIFVKDKRQKGVILQASFRSNYSIIGIPLAVALGGEGSVQIVAVISAVAIPTFNVLAVISLSVFSNNKISIKKILIDIVKNPLVIGIFCGVVVLVFRTYVFKNADFWIRDNLSFLYNTFDMVGMLTTAFSLIVLGGAFKFGSIKSSYFQITLGTVLRLIIAPVICFVFYFLLIRWGVLDNEPYNTVALIPLVSTPVAVSSAIMAKEMDSDSDLANSLVVYTSLFSVITIFSLCMILKSMGAF
ncbi:MAG: AEC family transporter [Acholeplasmatales bacterium]|jgi:predicted permease|nr:AEC family transporter [Acholeplasmatales bacterium]